MAVREPPTRSTQRLGRTLQAWQPAVQVTSGVLLGGLLVVLFTVVYSHEIFFSDRWDPYKPKYFELWFFTLSVAVLVPVMLRSIKKELLAWYTRLAAAGSAVGLVIWMAGTWPVTTAEAGYTSMGYAFVENMIPFQASLHLVASALVSSLLGHVAVDRERKQAGFTRLAISVLGILGTGAVMVAMLLLFQYAGLLVILAGCPVAIGSMLLLDLVPALMRPHAEETVEPGLPGRDAGMAECVEGTPARARAVIFTSIIIALAVALPYTTSEKTWEAVASFFPFILPLIEIIAIVFFGIATWASKGRLGIRPRAYSDVIRAVICLASSVLGLVVALMVSGYYRDLAQTMAVLLVAVAGGYLVGMLLQASGKVEMSEAAMSNRLNATMLVGLGLLGLSCAGGALVWVLFLQDAEPLPSGYIDSRTVPFPGIAGTVAVGVAIGMLLCGGLGSLGTYHRKTVLTRSGEPAWNVNSTGWLAMLVPAGFYAGQVFFESRIFEWGAYLETNILGGITTLLVAGALAGLFVAVGGLSLPRLGRTRPVPAGSTLPPRAARSAVLLVAIVTGAFLGVGWAVTSIPKAEPLYRVQIASNESFTLWTTYPGEKVAASYVPGSFQSSHDAIAVTMAAGETERVHMVVTPRANMGELRVNISNLRDPISGEYFPSDGINWYYATYNFGEQEEQLIPGNPYQYRGRENVTDAYLATINSWTVSPGKNQPLWLSFTSKYNTTAGVYGGNITISWITTEGPGSLIIPVMLTVVAYQKPISYRLTTSIGWARGAESTRGRSLWRHGRMGYNAAFPQMVLPKFWSINWTAGTYTLDFTAFYAAMNACAQAGYTYQVYQAFSHEMLSTTEVTPFSAQWNGTVLAILGNASLNMSNTHFNLPHGQGKIRAIDMFVDELYDEPGKDDAHRFRFGQLLNMAAPSWRLMCTCGISMEAAGWPGWSGPGGVFDVVDVRVQMPFGFQLYRDDPAVRHLADVVYPAEEWIYWINSPWPPCPNSAQAYNPGSAVFSQAIQYYTISNVTGFLFWTAGDDAWADGGDGYAGWGSGRYFYRAADGSGDWDPSYRFEMLDDGLEVSELLRHLDDIIGDGNGTAGPLDSAALLRATGIRNEFEAMFPDFYSYPRPDQLGNLISLRHQLLQFLVEHA